MNSANLTTKFVDGVPVATATSIEDAPAIRLTDDWDAAYHEDIADRDQLHHPAAGGSRAPAAPAPTTPC